MSFVIDGVHSHSIRSIAAHSRKRCLTSPSNDTNMICSSRLHGLPPPPMRKCALLLIILRIDAKHPHPSSNQVCQFEYKLHLRQLSTGRPHPLAEKSTVVFLKGTVPAPERELLNYVYVTMEVLGENILILLHWRDGRNNRSFLDKLILFSWVDGTILSVSHRRTDC